MPLFGREAELTQREGYLGDILEGQGRMVVMCGAMGIGKTRLVHALLAGPAGNLRHRVATGGHRPGNRHLPSDSLGSGLRILGPLALDEGRLDEAERAARTGLDIAKADG